MKKNDHATAYFNFIKTASQVEKKIKEALQPFGLTHAQLNILAMLSDSSPNPLTPKEIKEGLVVGNPDVTRLIDRLCKKQLVERATSPYNRRQVDIRISKEGKVLFRKAHLSAKRAVGNYFNKYINEREARALNRILLKINIG
ncbi:MAG: MarR family transcriptional regulator [Bacteroidota bacterium]